MLLSQVGRYNQAARHTPWLVLVDLDRSADCAPPFVAAKLPHPSAAIRFRVAVRAAEAWLLADAEHIARFLSVPLARIPVNPDAELDPKATLIQIARRSRKRVIREELVPREGSGAKVGPGYAGRLIEFVAGADQMWHPDVAAQHSESLRRCIVSLQTLHGWQIG